MAFVPEGQAIVAWHEVPGKPILRTRPVGYVEDMVTLEWREGLGRFAPKEL